MYSFNDHISVNNIDNFIKFAGWLLNSSEIKCMQVAKFKDKDKIRKPYLTSLIRHFQLNPSLIPILIIVKR